MSTFVVHPPQEKFHDDLDSTAPLTARSGYRLDSYTLDFEPDNTLNTPQYSDDFEAQSTQYTAQYSEDFDSTSGGKRSYGRITRNPNRYSGELETIKTSIAETIPEETIHSVDDIEEDTPVITSARTSRITFQYPYDNDDDTVVPTSGRTSRLTWQYSEDFEDTDRYRETERDNHIYTAASLSTRLGGESDGDSELTDSTSDQHTWADSSELSEATSEATYLAEHNFLAKALNRLKHGPRQKVTIKLEKKPLSDEDMTALKCKKAFCNKLITKLRVQQQDSPRVSPSHGEQSVKRHLLGLTPGEYVENLGISHHAINKLRLENTKARLDKIAKEPVHQPRKCTYCRQVLEELARAEFVKAQIHRAQEKLIQDQVDMPPDLANVLMKEPIVLPGRIHREFAQSAPQDIWNRLADPEHTDTSGSEHVKNLDETLLEKLKKCPHVKKFKSRHTRTDYDYNDEIEQYIAQTMEAVKKVKLDLYGEVERLHNMESDEFWKTYFKKLTG